MSEYTRQKHKSVELINERLHDIAKRKRTTITKITWSDIDNRENHALLVENKSLSSTCDITDEALADYQGRSGTEITEELLESLIDRLIQ